MRWRQKLALSFVPRPLGPLLCSGRISMRGFRLMALRLFGLADLRLYN